MSILIDPTGNEIDCLRDMVDLHNLRVLEIGCGEGRLTWRYAGLTAQVTAIDPDSDAIVAAQQNVPAELNSRVTFLATSLQEFAASFSGERYDLALFSWSL